MFDNFIDAVIFLDDGTDFWEERVVRIGLVKDVLPPLFLEKVKALHNSDRHFSRGRDSLR